MHPSLLGAVVPNKAAVWLKLSGFVYQRTLVKRHDFDRDEMPSTLETWVYTR